MVTARTLTLLASVVLLASPSHALAQTWGSGPTPRDGACFYQDANYRGQYFCIDAGDSLDALPRGVRDNISSIRVYGRAQVNVFDEARFRGEARQFDDHVQNLAREGWNDTIQSIRVRGGGGFGNGNGNTGGNSRPSFGQNPDVIVRRAYEDILERQPDPAGLRLYRSRIIDDGWTEQQVREALRTSPEYRDKNTMTSAKAREIVRNAYLAVLRREPDSAGDGYVNRVMREKWTQQDVERELRRSDEFRNRPR